MIVTSVGIRGGVGFSGFLVVLLSGFSVTSVSVPIPSSSIWGAIRYIENYHVNCHEYHLKNHPELPFARTYVQNSYFPENDNDFTVKTEQFQDIFDSIAQRSILKIILKKIQVLDNFRDNFRDDFQVYRIAPLLVTDLKALFHVLDAEVGDGAHGVVVALFIAKLILEK